MDFPLASLARRLRAGGWEKRIAAILIVAGALCGFATWAALTASPPLGRDPVRVIWLLNLDLIILLLLLSVIARRIVLLWSGRRKGLPGAKLHARLVFIFSILAAIPAIVMTLFSAAFFHFGVQMWFSERVRTAVSESQAVAEAYLAEHQQVIKADVLAMANDIDRAAPILFENGATLSRVVQNQSLLRNLPEALIVKDSGRVLARSGLSFSLSFEDIPPEDLSKAQSGETVLMTGDHDDRIRALVRLNNFADTYLFVGRMVDPKVLGHLDSTRKASQEYSALEKGYSRLQITVTMIFVVVGFVMLLAAIWFGVVLASQLVTPIAALIEAAERVRGGDFTARVPLSGTLDEFEILGRSFNRMTGQIQEQRNELIAANRQLDRRRQFTETILSGVSSGIVGIDSHGIVTLANAPAAAFLETRAQDLTGRPLSALLPGVEPVLEQAHAKQGRVAQSEIPFRTPDGRLRTLLVRIALERSGAEDSGGAVLTFDDITDLQAAQRKAAWADVARRIAHEIKNPLTPIQLSAERLKRKYLKQIQTDPETFVQCTETIVRHVGDIGRMVGEFSAFARMPDAVLRAETLYTLVRDTVFLQQQAHPDILIALRAEGWPQSATVWCDAQQIRQALTNLLQNAVDSLRAQEAKNAKDPEKPHVQGRIDVCVAAPEDGQVAVLVADNGPGLPANVDPVRLVEPYVTLKEKGTGLGLAIVKKVMEDHKGRLLIGPPEWLRRTAQKTLPDGAVFALVFPVGQAASRTASGLPASMMPPV
jgi:two-component system nitrogen regulation sensor histidine kinase NtrY